MNTIKLAHTLFNVVKLDQVASNDLLLNTTYVERIRRKTYICDLRNNGYSKIFQDYLKETNEKDQAEATVVIPCICKEICPSLAKLNIRTSFKPYIVH